MGKMSDYDNRPKPHFKVYWIGIREGYGIDMTDEDVDEWEVFKTFREAKNDAVEKSKNDVEGARCGLKQTRALRKGDL